jgi:Amino acid permease
MERNNPQRVGFAPDRLAPMWNSSSGTYRRRRSSGLAGIILLFAGVEVEAVHVREMKDPARGYPAAIDLASVISLAIFVLGAIPVAAILPYESISLQAGDTFNAVIGDIWHMSWLVALSVMSRRNWRPRRDFRLARKSLPRTAGHGPRRRVTTIIGNDE